MTQEQATELQALITLRNAMSDAFRHVQSADVLDVLDADLPDTINNVDELISDILFSVET